MLVDRIASMLRRLFPVWRIRADDPDLWLHEAFALRASRPSRTRWMIALAQLLILPAAFFTIIDEVPDVKSRTVGIGWLCVFAGFYWWLPMKVLDPIQTWSGRLPRHVHEVFFGGVSCPAAIDLWLVGATPAPIFAAAMREMDTVPSRAVSGILAVAMIVPAAVVTLDLGAYWALPFLACSLFASFACFEGFKTLILADQCYDMALLWKALSHGVSRAKWRMRYLGLGVVVGAIVVAVIAAGIQFYANWMMEALRDPSMDMLSRLAVFAPMAALWAHAFHNLAQLRYRKALALAVEHFDDAYRRLASMQPAAR